MFISNCKRYRMKKWLLFSLLFLTSLSVHSEPLPASEVFKVSVKKIDPNTFAIQWNILPKYFLYSDRIQLNSDNDDIAQLGTLRFPTPLTKTNKQGRTFKVYRNQLTLPVGVLGITPGETIVNLGFQGCADDGFCYPPK